MFIDMTLYIKTLYKTLSIDRVYISGTKIQKTSHKSYGYIYKTQFTLNTTYEDSSSSSYNLFSINSNRGSTEPIEGVIKDRWWVHIIDITKPLGRELEIMPPSLVTVSKKLFKGPITIKTMIKHHPLPKKPLLKTLRVIPEDLFNPSPSLKLLKR